MSNADFDQGRPGRGVAVVEALNENLAVTWKMTGLTVWYIRSPVDLLL